MFWFLKFIEKSLEVLPSFRFLLCTSLVSLYGCSTAPKLVSTPVTGFNHTSAAINRFSVNGAGGHPVSAFQGGATQVCCGVLPAQWYPGLRATIEWEKDPNPREMIKRDKYGQFDKEDYQRNAAHYSHHEATVEIPKYGSDFCAIQVHFLPCDQIRISTTCFAPRNINYPDDSLFQLEESVICPVL
jgi:hypothetical protein